VSWLLLGALTLMISVHIVPFAHDQGISLAGASLALTAYGVGAVTGRVASGVVSDRITTVLCNPPIPGGACGPAPDTTDLLIRVPLLEAAFLLPIVAALVRVVRRAEASR